MICSEVHSFKTLEDNLVLEVLHNQNCQLFFQESATILE